MQRGSARVTHGLGAGESASARGPDPLQGRELGGRRQTSAAEAGKLELFPSGPELQRPASSARPRWPAARGGPGAGGGGGERA